MPQGCSMLPKSSSNLEQNILIQKEKEKEKEKEKGSKK